MTRFKLFLFAGAALLPAMPAYAQDDADHSGDIVIADLKADPHAVVVTAAGVAQNADQTGRAITVIDRAEIETRQTVAFSDLLSTVPGVGVTRNGGMGEVTTVRIRGAEGEQTLALIDGVRVNDPSSPGGGYDFANLLGGSVDRVEVLRGPNSVAWGSQAIGGVVNVVTAEPRNGFAARANAEGGSFGTANGNAAIMAGNETVSGAITGGYYTTDGISAAANGTEKDGYRQYGGTAKLRVDFAPDWAFDVRGYYSNSRAEYDANFPAPLFVVSDSADYSTSKELYGYAGLSGTLLDGKFRNKISVTAADINRDNFAAPGGAVSFFARGNSERYAYQGDLTVMDQVRAVFGAERENSRFTDGSPKVRQHITSFYGEAILDPVQQVTLNLGIRNDDHSGFGSHTTWSAAAAVRPFEGTLLRASYGEGFKAPTLYQRFSFFGTPGLNPETAKSYEFGAQQKLFDGVTLSGTWFHRNTRNQIDFDLGSFTYRNIARTRAQGYEIELAAQPVEGLNLRGGFTHVAAINQSAGNVGKDLARRPRDSASLSADYAFSFGLKAGATVQAVSHSFNDAGNFTRIPGYELVGIRAEFPVSEKIVVYGRVDNLFDKQYTTVTDYGAPGRAAYAGVRFKLD